MHRTHQTSRMRFYRSFGFTMVELLATIAIIVILSGIGIGVARYASQRADLSRAQSDMEKIADAMEKYRIEKGVYPSTGSTSWMDMADGGNWQSPFDPSDPLMDQIMDGLPMSDPWGGAAGQSYQYRRSSRFSFQLRSLGPDGNADTDDDILWPL